VLLGGCIGQQTYGPPRKGEERERKPMKSDVTNSHTLSA
jgi:hypothetical protein